MLFYSNFLNLNSDDIKLRFIFELQLTSVSINKKLSLFVSKARLVFTLNLT